MKIVIFYDIILLPETSAVNCYLKAVEMFKQKKEPDFNVIRKDYYQAFLLVKGGDLEGFFFLLYITIFLVSINSLFFIINYIILPHYFTVLLQNL